MLKKIITASISLYVLCLSLEAAEIIVPRKIIDSPTAGNLARGEYHLDFKVFPNGGILGEVVVGLVSKLYFGLSYGGSNIIGSGGIRTNTGPGILAQYRIIDENLILPAIAVGYNNQAIGPYYSANGRYEVKAKGVYVVLSKNYRMLGNLGLHGGLNYRIEEEDPRPSLFVMINKDINSELFVSAEYDAAINDEDIDWGYLNLGLAWILGGRFQLEFDFKNILENRRFIDVNRELRLVYMERF